MTLLQAQITVHAAGRGWFRQARGTQPNGAVKDRAEYDTTSHQPSAIRHLPPAISDMHAYAGTNASTRSGLPDPSTIFSGAAMMTAPVGGS